MFIMKPVLLLSLERLGRPKEKEVLF